MLPIAYTALAKGDTLIYLVMEIAYDTFSFLLVAAGFYWGGITGTGIALSVASFLDVIMISVCYGRKYGFRYFPSTVRLILYQAVQLAAGVVVCIYGTLLLKCTLGVILLFASAFYSFRVLQKRTAMLSNIKKKFFNRK